MHLQLKTYRGKGGKKVKRWIIRDQSNGKDKTKTLGVMTKNEAMRMFVEFKEQYENGTLTADHKLKFNELRNSYIADMKSYGAKSIDRNLRCFDVFAQRFGNMKLIDFKKSHITDFINFRLNQGISQSTVYRELAVVKRCFNLAIENEVFAGKNPVGKKTIKKVDNERNRVLTPDEQVRLLEVSPEYLKRVILVAVNTGLRKSELTSLKWESVFLDCPNPYIEITAENSKSRKSRKVPLNKVALSVLSSIERIHKQVFTGRYRRPFKSGSSINKSWWTALRKAEIFGLVFHDLRHTFCSRTLYAGIPVHVVSNWLGHSSLEMTKRYCHILESQNSVIDRLDSFNENVVDIGSFRRAV